jgi:hypothetical protein
MQKMKRRTNQSPKCKELEQWLQQWLKVQNILTEKKELVLIKKIIHESLQLQNLKNLSQSTEAQKKENQVKNQERANPYRKMLKRNQFSLNPKIRIKNQILSRFKAKVKTYDLK